ncbi:hypothetical protein VE03_10199, partial [Pseudogymnoascus sp. 23342-1-I1]
MPRYPRLPALGVIFTDTLAEVLVPAAIITLIFRTEVHLVGILFKVREVMRCVPTLQNSAGGSAEIPCASPL